MKESKGINLVKYMLIAIVFFLILCAIVLAIFLGVSSIKNKPLYEQINNDFQMIYSDENYKQPQNIEGISVIEQKFSPSYAVIEMLAKWQGLDITEESIRKGNENNSYTYLGVAFEQELKKQFPNIKVTRYKDLSNTEMIDKIYTSLAQGIPVPVEIGVKNKPLNKNTMIFHYVLVTGIDIPNDKITALDPFGTVEEYKVEDFLTATRFEGLSMPILYRVGFALKYLNKNALHILEF